VNILLTFHDFRCKKFDLSYVYTSTHSPTDEEVLDVAALVQQLDILHNQIENMEETISKVKSNHNITSLSLSGSIPSFFRDNVTVSSIEDANSVAWVPADNNSLIHRPTKRTKMIGSIGDDIRTFLNTDIEEQNNASKAKPWTLTFQKGNIRVNTHVTTHSDLLDNLYHMIGSVELMASVPSMFKHEAQENNLIGLLNSMIRMKCGKAHCKSVAKSVRIFITPDLSTVNTMVVAQSPDSIQTTTNKLLRAYLRCQHLQQLAINARTIIRFFIDNSNNLEESPAAMALCAAICTFRCKHVAECLPSISLVEYGKFYFDHARDLVSDHFDQYNLDIYKLYIYDCL
jgi:hypothetical protein